MIILVEAILILLMSIDLRYTSADYRFVVNFGPLSKILQQICYLRLYQKLNNFSLIAKYKN